MYPDSVALACKALKGGLEPGRELWGGALGRVQYSEGNRKLKRGVASVDYPGLLFSRPGPPVT